MSEDARWTQRLRQSMSVVGVDGDLEQEAHVYTVLYTTPTFRHPTT